MLIVEQEVLGLTGDRMSLVAVQVMAELSGSQVSFQSQTETSEEVNGVRSV